MIEANPIFTDSKDMTLTPDDTDINKSGIEDNRMYKMNLENRISNEVTLNKL